MPVIAVVITVALSVTSSWWIGEVFKVDGPKEAKLEQRTLELINEAREEAELEPLGWDRSLGKLADERSQQQAELGVVAHFHPETGEYFLGQLWQENNLERVSNGEVCCVVSAIGTADSLAEKIVSGFRSSPDHWYILTSPEMQVAAVGTAQRGIGLFVTIIVATEYP